MPNTKNNRRGLEHNRIRENLFEKSSSFHGRVPSMKTVAAAEQQLRRPKTLPDLFVNQSPVRLSPDSRPELRPKLTKLLLNVTTQGSVGALQVIMSPENTVADLVAAAVRQYVKECRRPILPTADPSGFDLHYSQFSLESLEREEKLMELGSRNFFLCQRKAKAAAIDGGDSDAKTTCSKEAGNASKMAIPWLKFMDFLL